jgi:cytochrome c-type biogenesis protein CcmE
MTHLKLKLAVAGIVFASAIGFLAFAGAQKGWVYTMGVDQYLQSPDQQKQRVRLCGTVAPDNIEVQKALLTAKFSLKGEHELIPVAYKGVVPDMFKAGCEVVIEGKRDPAGTFQADLMMTKCASKYDEMPNDHPKTADAQPPKAGA